jgi:hypothetical protein
MRHKVAEGQVRVYQVFKHVLVLELQEGKVEAEVQECLAENLEDLWTLFSEVRYDSELLEL